jgi:hypothetical protein
VPVPPVQGTKEPVGLLWWTRLDTPHSGRDRPKSGSPGVPGQGRSAFCDGPELRHGRTDVVNLYIGCMMWFNNACSYKFNINIWKIKYYFTIPQIELSFLLSLFGFHLNSTNN